MFQREQQELNKIKVLYLFATNYATFLRLWELLVWILVKTTGRPRTLNAPTGTFIRTLWSVCNEQKLKSQARPNPHSCRETHEVDGKRIRSTKRKGRKHYADRSSGN